LNHEEGVQEKRRYGGRAIRLENYRTDQRKGLSRLAKKRVQSKKSGESEQDRILLEKG